MHRRTMLTAALAGIGGLFAAASATRPAAAVPAKQKVVYHLSDLDKVAFVLGNIRNHVDGMGGPDNVSIALVVHGPALKAFRSASASPEIAQRLIQFAKNGVELAACGNTMKGMDVTLKDLVPGFVVAERGGVVRIAELQGHGYVYLRP